MPDVTNALARSLIALHGEQAVVIAERAAENVRMLHMQDKADEWMRVAEAVKTMQEAGRDR
jgi:hypothetical protein